MKKSYKLITIFTLSLFMSNCSTSISNINSNILYQSKNNSLNRVISGYLQTKSFNIKSVSSIVTNKAQITMMYSNNNPNLNLRGKIVATGLSDSNGFFFLITKNNFVPNTGEIFILEATIRSKGGKKNNISLRTNVRWNGSSYESIINGKLLINSLTTAVSVISELKNIYLADSIKKFNIVDNKIIINNINQNINIELINDVKNLVEDALISGNDPISTIKYSNNKFYSTIENKLSFLNGCAGDCKGQPFTIPDSGGTELDNTEIAPGYTEPLPIDLNDSRIAYVSYDTNYYLDEIKSVKSDNTDTHTISYETNDDYSLILNSINNGNQIAYYNNGDIFFINSDGSEKNKIFSAPENPNMSLLSVNIDNNNGVFFVLSPQGDKIIVNDNEQNDGINNSLFISDGTNYLKITQDGGIKYPLSFSPDGKKVLFVKYTIPRELYIYDLENNNVNKIFSINKPISSVSWFNDSSRVLLVPYTPYNFNYTTNYFQKDLPIINLDGSINNLTYFNHGYVTGIYEASVSHDDKLIAFSAYQGLAIMNTDGSNIRLLSQNSNISGIKWSMDNKTILYNSNEGLCAINTDNTHKIIISSQTNATWIKKYNGDEVFPTPAPTPESTPTPAPTPEITPTPDPSPSCNDYDIYNPC